MIAKDLEVNNLAYLLVFGFWPTEPSEPFLCSKTTIKNENDVRTIADLVPRPSKVVFALCNFRSHPSVIVSNAGCFSFVRSPFTIIICFELPIRVRLLQVEIGKEKQSNGV